MTDPRPGPPYSAFFGRLRARPLSSWPVRDRVAAARAASAELAGLAWAAEGRGDQAVPPVPDLGPHVLADQLQVLVADALAAGVEAGRVHAVVTALADRLNVRVD